MVWRGRDRHEFALLLPGGEPGLEGQSIFATVATHAARNSRAVGGGGGWRLRRERRGETGGEEACIERMSILSTSRRKAILPPMTSYGTAGILPITILWNAVATASSQRRTSHDAHPRPAVSSVSRLDGACRPAAIDDEMRHVETRIDELRAAECRSATRSLAQQSSAMRTATAPPLRDRFATPERGPRSRLIASSGPTCATPRDLRQPLRARRDCHARAGIGAATSVFTVASGVLLRPLPFVDPDRIVHPSAREQARARYKHIGGRLQGLGDAEPQFQRDGCDDELVADAQWPGRPRACRRRVGVLRNILRLSSDHSSARRRRIRLISGAAVRCSITTSGKSVRRRLGHRRQNHPAQSPAGESSA